MAEKTHSLEGSGYGPSSRHQINENNKRRAKPVVSYDLSPTGPIRKEIMSRAANVKNLEIDRDNAFMEQRLARRKNVAKKNFNERSENSWGLG